MTINQFEGEQKADKPEVALQIGAMRFLHCVRKVHCAIVRRTLAPFFKI